ncbi:MAG: phage head closure protein [Sulfuriferula sp.]
MGIRSGSLRKRIQIQQRAATQDTFGSQSATWTTIAIVWADIEILNGRALMAAQAVNVEISHTITVRYQPIFYDPKIVAAYRCLYNGRIFNIHWMENVEERNAIVVLTVSEGLNNG